MRSQTLVTGATGFLGRGLVRGLLARGERVTALVRDADRSRTGARARLVAALGTRYDRAELRVIPGDLTVPESIGAVAGAGPFRETWHLAAAVDLSARRPGAVSRANLGGTAAALALSTGVDRFHHLSTAYAGGIADRPLPEGPLPAGPAHRNPYERSKYDAEGLVREAAVRGLSVTVYRPSIVVGDSRTGRAEVYGAFYQLVRLCRLARGLPEIVLSGRAETRVDLVPVDRVVAALLELSDREDTRGGTYHLVSPAPPTVAELVAAGRRVLGLPISAVRDVPPHELPWPGCALFSPAAPILDYLRSAPGFARGRTADALGEHFLAGAGGTGAWLDRLLAAAEEDRFGRNERQSRRDARHLRHRLARAAATRPVAV